MLHNLYVKNLALIDEMEVEFHNGLNILTGETGAGKSIILGSINLALGGRYSSDMLRNEEEAGYVELTFFVENDSQVELLKEKDIFPEDGVVTLSRKLIGKRSVSKINGESVSIAQLKDVAGILIDIHGQHEHQSLLYKKNHLVILDSFAKDEIKEVKSKTLDSYQNYKKFKEELESANLDEKERNKEMSFLEFEINENIKKELDEIDEKLHFSNDNVIMEMDANIRQMIIELENNIDNENFNSEEQIKAISSEIDRRNVFAKNII